MNIFINKAIKYSLKSVRTSLIRFLLTDKKHVLQQKCDWIQQLSGTALCYMPLVFWKAAEFTAWYHYQWDTIDY